MSFTVIIKVVVDSPLLVGTNPEKKPPAKGSHGEANAA